MGGCVSLSIPFDQCVNHSFNCLCGDGNYLRNLQENIEALQGAKEDLKAKREDLSTRAANEEGGDRRRLKEVEKWISDAEKFEEEVDRLLSAKANQIQRLCLYGYCSKKLISSCKYGKRVFEMRKEVDDHKSKCDFKDVTGRAPAPTVELRPVRPTVGREDLLEKTWRCLMDDDVGILGLYGMGGVGKTTLLKHINNKFRGERGTFDVVIWVVVSKDVQIQSVQDEIGDKLGFKGEEWKHKGTYKKASDIYTVLNGKRFVLLLDDIWNKVDLIEIGVPFPSKKSGSKVVFTTRSKEVCGCMGVDAEMEVRCLAWNDAWDLFKKKVGEITLGSDPDIPKLAAIVAEKCRGLPLALNVIGETMASKRTVEEWCHADGVLKLSAEKFLGMEEEIFPILKYSYDNLREEKIQLCFQYCALFPEDYQIHKRMLVEYWITEGIIDENEDMEIAENEGYDIIGTLVCACLLVEEKGDFLKMHDVVRQMALWVASDMGKQKERFIVKVGAKLCEMPKVKNWKGVRRVSLLRNHIEEMSGSPQCDKLKTLFLQNNKLVKISGEFFQHMPRLLVLDLSANRDLEELPDEICDLGSLRYLNLSATTIKRLPRSFHKLEKLMNLNLESTNKLESILGVSRLSSLKVLRLAGSKLKVDSDVVKDLQSMEHLKVLTMSMSADSALESVLRDKSLASCIEGLFMVNLESRGISFAATMDRLRVLRIHCCAIPEIKIERRCNERESGLPRYEPAGPCFPNLSTVHIRMCRGMRDLTWLLCAPNLAELWLFDCDEVEEVIRKEKAENGSSNMILFQRLEILVLEGLRELESIYWTPLHFPSLKTIEIQKCPKLRKLPLDSKSVPAADDNSLWARMDEECLGRIEWDDNAQQRFLPIFHRTIGKPLV